MPKDGIERKGEVKLTIKNTEAKVVSTSSEEIIIRGLKSKINAILDICHRKKHLFKDGYEHGRKTRKALGKVTERWADCPEICFAYLLTDDFDEDKRYKGHNDLLKISILISDETSLLKRYTREQIDDIAYKYATSVADEIEAKLINKEESLCAQA